MKYDHLLNKIRQKGNCERAQSDQKYHKSNRTHWGVTAPLCTELARSFALDCGEDERLELVECLWNTEVFDVMICAAKVLCLPKVRPSRKVWQLIVKMLQKVDGWALEDTLCPIAWKCILNDAELLDEVELWTRHQCFWMRRAALIYTLPFAKPGRNPERMLQWASSYSNDPEWFIQKAIGWWLRVLGGHNPQRVILFLNEHASSLKGVAKKEATRKLSPEWHKCIHFLHEKEKNANAKSRSG